MAMGVADFALAWPFGIVFQYFSIVPIRDDVRALRAVWLAIPTNAWLIRRGWKEKM